jgi:hypothetical protein
MATEKRGEPSGSPQLVEDINLELLLRSVLIGYGFDVDVEVFIFAFSPPVN